MCPSATFRVLMVLKNRPSAKGAHPWYFFVLHVHPFAIAMRYTPTAMYIRLCLSVCLYQAVSACRSVCLYIRLCLPVGLSVCIRLCLSVGLSDCIRLCLSVCLTVSGCVCVLNVMHTSRCAALCAFPHRMACWHAGFLWDSLDSLHTIIIELVTLV